MSERTIDAVLIPVGYAKGSSFEQKYRALDAEFKVLLGGGRLWYRNVGAATLVVPDEHDTLLFPGDHPTKAKEDRYTWQDRGDGVKLGTLVPDDAGAGPGAEEAARMNAEAIGKLKAAGAVPAGPGEATHAG